MKLAQYIDHTLLKPTATPQDISNLCHEAKKHEFYAVCVNSCYVAQAKTELRDTSIKVAAVIGFPLGANSTNAKIFEAKDCIANAADEIDMVLNIGWLKAGLHQQVQDEIAKIKKSIGNKILKVIIETCYLSKKEIKKACELSQNAGADFVKTSTGFGTAGATFEDVQLMKETIGEKLKIKASGGIRDIETAQNYIKIGVARLGTSSSVVLLTSKK